MIGTERQFRGHLAGLRANALVSLGAAGFVVFANLGLRPIVRRLKHAAARNARDSQVYILKFECLHDEEVDLRADLIASLSKQGLTLQQIASQSNKRTVEISAQVTGQDAAKTNIENVLAHMSLTPRVLRASWSAAEDDEDA